MPVVEGGEEFLGVVTGIENGGGGVGFEEIELEAGGGALEVGEEGGELGLEFVFKNRHRGGGVEDDGDLLGGGGLVVAGLDEEPGEEEDHEELHPEGDGVGEAVEAVAGGGFALGLF